MNAAPPNFGITSTCPSCDRCHRPAMTVVSARGEIDAATSGRFAEALDIAAGCAEGSLLVDLTEIGFIDAKGYVAVLEAERRMREREGEVVVVCDRTVVRRILTLLSRQGRLRLCP